MRDPKSKPDYLANWQFETPKASTLKVATTDSELIALYESGERLIGLQGGDLYKSLGGSGVAGLEADGVNTVGLKLDLGQLVVDESSYLFASYCKLLKPMKPWSTIWIINSPIIGQRRISPKSHPGDGWLDVVEFSLSFRQSLKAYKRSSTGDHLPHPQIKTSKKRTFMVNSNRKSKIVIDGKKIGFGKEVSISIIPHAIGVVLL